MGRRKNKAEVATLWEIRPCVTTSVSEPVHVRASQALTQEEALKVLWSAKTAYQLDENGNIRSDCNGRPVSNPQWCNAFVYATLRKEAAMRYSTDDESKVRIVKSGTRVLVTMVSRFGDVGIRDDRLVPASNGYYARVLPEDLTDWNMAP